jgi:RHS repeat-associated protein
MDVVYRKTACYEYDVFGEVYEGDLSGGMNPAVCCALRRKPPKITCKVIFYPANCQGSPYIVVFAAQSDSKTYKCDRLPGYTGKPYDVVTGMYNYGYRDYAPELARFTTEDPIRDGANWFAYVNNDPVNWVDLWGLEGSDILIINMPGITDGRLESYLFKTEHFGYYSDQDLIGVKSADNGVQLQNILNENKDKAETIIFAGGHSNDFIRGL